MTCIKTAYPTRGEALDAMEHIVSQRTGRGKYERRAYKCPHCRQWHLTSQKDKNSKYQYKPPERKVPAKKERDWLEVIFLLRELKWNLGNSLDNPEV